LTESQAEVEVAPGTVITVARQVVVRRVDELEDDSATPDDSEPDGPTRTED
jgi:preprotein translocase subunit YajC